MRAGRLRARCIFESERRVSDGAGGAEAGTWRTIMECRGDYLPEPGREAIAAGHVTGSNMGTLRVRSSSKLTDLDTSARVLIDDVIHNIRSGPIDPDQRRRTFEFIVEKGVAPYA